MKLSDLRATVTGPKFTRILIGLSQETYEQLAPYRKGKETGGFVRLATEMLLALTKDDDEDVMGQLPDKLVVRCESMENLETLISNFEVLLWQLGEREAACVDGDKTTSET